MSRKKKPTPPEHLDEQGRRKWAEVSAILDGRGDILDAGTLDALACYASAWSQWLTAEAQVKTLGLVVKSPAGFAQENPFLSVARKAQTELRRWGDVLRLTPKAKGTRSTNASTGKPATPSTPNPLATLKLRAQ
jgi:P27 family predicted phage terminase small subunit